jgi:hypothetical protein
VQKKRQTRGFECEPRQNSAGDKKDIARTGIQIETWVQAKPRANARQNPNTSAHTQNGHEKHGTATDYWLSWLFLVCASDSA